MKWREQSDILMRKAQQDLLVVRKLAGQSDVTDEIIGFHGQQAAEKMFKAVLCIKQVSYRRTHDLIELIDLLAAAGVSLPPDLEQAKDLMPFAVELRYDDPSPHASALDRTWIIDCLLQMHAWAISQIQANP